MSAIAPFHPAPEDAAAAAPDRAWPRPAKPGGDRAPGGARGVRTAIRALLVVALLAGAARGAPLAAWMALPPLTLADQHDVSTTIGPQTRVILFTRDMDAGDLVKEALAGHAALLTQAQAVYVSDISGMPSLIARLFALPAMRKRPYPMLIDRDGSATADFPTVEGKVTVLRLRALQIEAVEYADSVAAVRAALASGGAGPD
jgi:hypothetical protein